MSLPWILIDHALKTKDSYKIESVLYLLDLYNDSAQYALTKFRKQFLYDEIEAEVNLCFDQFVFILSNAVFLSYKHLAGSLVLDKCYRRKTKKDKIQIEEASVNRYDSVLGQRHVYLLGRIINLNRLITQRVNGFMRSALEMAFSKFEAGDLTGIMELEGLIRVNRLTHTLLCKHLSLDNFDIIFAEVNEKDVGGIGRLIFHIFREVYGDFLPNYCYNSSTNRFVKCKELPFGTPMNRNKAEGKDKNFLWGHKSLTEAFSKKIYPQYSGFIGSCHFEVICRLLGYEGIAVVLQELLKAIKSLIQDTLLPFTKSLMEVLPNACKRTLVEYGSKGTLQCYSMALKDVITYSDTTELFHHLRELGNSVLFCLMIQNSLFQEEVRDLLQAAPFLGIVPDPICNDGEDLAQKKKALKKEFASLNLVELLKKNGKEEQIKLGLAGSLLTRERLCCGLSIFGPILGNIETFLDDPVWRGPPPKNGIYKVDECDEFHRLWSALQFLFCIPLGKNLFTVEQLFGEGLQWGGLTILTLLGQQHRFQLFDFSYHIAQLHDLDQNSEIVDNIKIPDMVARIKAFRRLNQQIFMILNKYIEETELKDSLNPIIHLQPPLHPQETANKS